ncbi:MAG: c-type cytochrome biogenesis protein CcsB [Candidatus Riflebacteria bacterium]|nr:c-type cytochrome biogenesis protein CcsB [Candidatus Riflebacteria bacterium]
MNSFATSPESMLFALALFAYLFSFVAHVVAAGLGRENLYRFARLASWGGATAGTIALGLRWQASGHPPLSNMYESLVTLATFTVWITLAFTRSTPFGIVEGGTAVIAVLMTGIASLFPQESSPLVPALQSYWLHVHVAVAFLGESCFALAFALSYLYCFRRLVTESGTTGENANAPTALERQVCAFLVWGVPLGFIGSMCLLMMRMNENPETGGKWHTMLAWVIGPAILASVALVVGMYLLRGSVGKTTERILPSEERLDEFIYRAIALGYPLYTVGAIIFGMVWANKAWGRYWGWDPKETWALITFLVYSIYLHVRLTKGWRGTWTAVLSLVGFLVTLFTLFGVNLLLSGLHSYAAR